MIQDPSQLHAPSLSSPSDLVQVVPEVTDSQPETAMAQVSPHLDDPLSRSNPSMEEVVSEATESEAVRLLASRIPPELFDDILFYINVDRVSQREEYDRDDGNDLTRNRGEPSPGDILTDLKQCSLVCLFWANRCRQHMFSGKTLEINSYEDAEIFRRYVVGGCPRLTPVYQLIDHIRVHHNYSGVWASKDHERQTSFLHLLYLPVLQHKLKYLDIEGPVPDNFNPAKLDTPHWGIPPSVVVPSSFLKNNISVRDVHLPSFRHVTKYIKHFSCATYVVFREITWDGQTPTYLLPQASNIITCQRRPGSLRIEAEGVCTDSVHLALTAMMMNPNCPLHRLSDEERVWMIEFMTLLWGHRRRTHVWIGFDISEQATTMELSPFRFVFKEALASTDRSVSALSVVGMHAYILRGEYLSFDLPANFDALVIPLRTHPTIRSVVLLFESFDRLQKSMKPFAHLLSPAPEAIDFVLAYHDRVKKLEEHRAIGVDPVTLERSGYVWGNFPKGVYLSEHILRQELKRRY